MRIWIASTAVNRGRRFWKCKYSGVFKIVSFNLFFLFSLHYCFLQDCFLKFLQKAASCELFVWDDELDFETMNFVSVSEASEEATMKPYPQKVCECKCGQNLKEWESKKIANLKLKLCDERKKMRWMQAIVVLVIVVLVFQKFEMVKK